MTRLRWVVVLGWVVIEAGTTSVAAALPPPPGTYTGYYRVDRYGLHTFNGMPIEPGAQEAFSGFRDRLVTVEVEEFRQPINPGTIYVRRVGKVALVGDHPVTIQLAWAGNKERSGVYNRINRGEEYKFAVTVTNKLDTPLGPETVRGDGFVLTGIGPANLPPGDAKFDMSKYFPGPVSPSREWRESRFSLGARKSTTWMITMSNAVPGEYEFKVSFAEYRAAEEKWWFFESNLLRLDVVSDHPKPAAGLEVDLIPTLNPPQSPQPIPAKLVLRNTGPRPLNFSLPYREGRPAADRFIYGFNRSGAMIQGPLPYAHSSDDFFDLRGIRYQPQRLEPKERLTLDVTLPSDTEVAVARIREWTSPPMNQMKPDEDYFRDRRGSDSAHVIVRR